MERHTQRVKYLNALGRPCTPDHNHRNKPCVKKGPKKGHKEKHFGDNKKNYAPTDPQLYHLRVGDPLGHSSFYYLRSVFLCVLFLGLFFTQGLFRWLWSGVHGRPKAFKYLTLWVCLS